jgi:hypothetical protein
MRVNGRGPTSTGGDVSPYKHGRSWLRKRSGEQCAGGWGGIRTHGELPPTPVFKTGALNRSATHPEWCGEKNIILDLARHDFTRDDEPLWRRRRRKPDQALRRPRCADAKPAETTAPASRHRPGRPGIAGGSPAPSAIRPPPLLLPPPDAGKPEPLTRLAGGPRPLAATIYRECPRY